MEKQAELNQVASVYGSIERRKWHRKNREIKEPEQITRAYARNSPFDRDPICNNKNSHSNNAPLVRMCLYSYILRRSIVKLQQYQIISVIYLSYYMIARSKSLTRNIWPFICAFFFLENATRSHSTDKPQKLYS